MQTKCWDSCIWQCKFWIENSAQQAWAVVGTTLGCSAWTEMRQPPHPHPPPPCRLFPYKVKCQDGGRWPYWINGSRWECIEKKIRESNFWWSNYPENKLLLFIFADCFYTVKFQDGGRRPYWVNGSRWGCIEKITAESDFWWSNYPEKCFCSYL